MTNSGLYASTSLGTTLVINEARDNRFDFATNSASNKGFWLTENSGSSLTLIVNDGTNGLSEANGDTNVQTNGTGTGSPDVVPGL